MRRASAPLAPTRPAVQLGDHREVGTGQVTIDWAMSASLENVRRGAQDVPEVTNLEVAVLEWLDLPKDMQAVAELTPEHAIQLNDEGPTLVFRGHEIERLAALLRP